MHPQELYKSLWDLNQKLKIEKIRNIALDLQYENLYFAKPYYSKKYWEFSALVLEERGYPCIKDVIPELFEWLKDLIGLIVLELKIYFAQYLKVIFLLNMRRL